ncbi:MAG: hypothetical protein LLF76_13625 [Planctomycetaceae bacterium]|nr:hypothetical protein [Planctomycetaceae bacterium]
MEPKAKEQLSQEEINRLIEALPEEVQSLCGSGKAVLDLAHLVKNLLQMVSGSSEIMQLALERKEYDRLLKSWAIFEPNFIRLKKFLMDLIKFTKQYPLRMESCDINERICRAIKNCDPALRSHGVQIEMTPGPGIPACLLDSDRMEEIASDLITHGIDNIGGSGVIKITTVYLDGSNEIELTCSDDGPALSMAAIRSLRQPSERTRNMCGTGFDIPLAALYVEQHGGYMEIESTAPRGNVVHVYLPIRL